MAGHVRPASFDVPDYIDHIHGTSECEQARLRPATARFFDYMLMELAMSSTPLEVVCGQRDRYHRRAVKLLRQSQSRTLWLAQNGRSRIGIRRSRGLIEYRVHYREPLRDEIDGWRRGADRRLRGASHYFQLVERISDIIRARHLGEAI